MMNNSWNLTGDSATYQKYQKGWAGEDNAKPAAGYARKNDKPSGQPTLKSGVQSNDSPFGHMSNYYDGHSSPRQSLANNKHIKEKRGDYNEVPGQQSSYNPFTNSEGGLNDKYTNHVTSKYKQNQYNQPYGSMAAQKQREINIQKFKDKIMKRGAKGLICLKRQFKIMDSDASGALDFNEFTRALEDYKVGLSEDEAKTLFASFDRNKDGTINFEEFMAAILGNLSDFRVNLVK